MPDKIFIFFVYTLLQIMYCILQIMTETYDSQNQIKQETLEGIKNKAVLINLYCFGGRKHQLQLNPNNVRH